MPRPMPTDELDELEKAVRAHGGAVTASVIAEALSAPMPRRTLQYRLKRLVDDGRLVMEGEGRWAKYRAPEARGAVKAEAPAEEESGLRSHAPVKKSERICASRPERAIRSAMNEVFWTRTVRERASICPAKSARAWPRRANVT